MHKRNQRLVIFAKAPVLGQVKSRIAVETGEEKALSIYKQLLQHVFEQLSNVSGFETCSYSNQPEHEFFEVYKSSGIKFHQQIGNDLGQRMYNALEEEINDSSSVVLIGSDCPRINKAVIKEAFQKLSSGYQGVIAPAEDGGYVLIGFSGDIPKQIFEDIEWGAESVFQQTRQKITKLNLKLCQLATLADIDTYADYQKWQSGLNTKSGIE